MIRHVITHGKPAGTTRELKQHNIEAVRQMLKRSLLSTIRELSESSGLSYMTVNTIISQMLDRGEVVAEEENPSFGGRPSRVFRINERSRLVLVLFFHEVQGEQFLNLRIADLFGKVIDSRNIRMDSGPPEILFAPLDQCLSDYPAIKALGIGLPGVESEGSILIVDYPEWIGEPLRSLLENRYRVPVLIENDVNAAVLGCSRGEQDFQTEVYLYFPEKRPPGAGIRIDGKVLKGKKNFAGEIKWLPLDIPWGTSVLISSPELMTAAISRVIISLSAVLAPESVILYGESLTEEILQSVKSGCRNSLPEGMAAEIRLSTDFTADYQQGLINLALGLVE